MINNVNTSNKNHQKALENTVFNIFSQQANRKKPNKAKGKLLPETFVLQDATIGTLATIKDGGNLIGALTSGKSDDCKLGRMNDLGLKLGGAAIASYLYTQKLGKSSKMMEFVGLGAFLSSMYLWQKLFIATPIKMRYGFDINRKYIDNQGNKKKFFQDNQYLPWDIWDKKEIDKVADKMNIENNIKDKDEYTKKKMQKTALQANTLTMLTTGFGTPLMAALMCDKLEGIVDKFNYKTSGKKYIKYIEELVQKPEIEIKKEEIESIKKGIFEALDSTEPNEKSISKVIDILFKDCSDTSAISHALEEDIEKIAKSNKILDRELLTEKIKETFFKENRQIFNAEGEMEIVKAPTKEQIKNILDSVDVNAKDAREKIAYAFKSENLTDNVKDFTKKLNEIFEKNKEILTFDKEKMAETLSNLYATSIKPFAVRLNSMQKLLEASCGETADSLATANYKAMAKEFMAEMGLNLKQLEQARLKGDPSIEIMQKALKTKATEETVFKTFIKDILAKRAKYNKNTEENIKLAQTSGYKILDDCKEILDKDTFKNLRKLFEQNSENSIYMDFDNTVKSAAINLDAIMARLITGIDFERKLIEDTSLKRIKEAANSCGIPFEEYVDTCRKIIYEHGMTEFRCKNEIDRPTYYLSVMDTLFGKDLSEAAQSALKEGAFNTSISHDMIKNTQETKTALENAKQRIYDIAVSIKKHGKHDFTLSGHETGLGEVIEYKGVGVPLGELLQSNATQSFNHNKWFKIFGTSFAVLAGVTILSQKFFGKIKDEHLYKKQENQELQGGAKNVNK